MWCVACPKLCFFLSSGSESGRGQAWNHFYIYSGSNHSPHGLVIKNLKKMTTIEKSRRRPSKDKDGDEDEEPTSPSSPLAQFPPPPPAESRSRAPEFYGFVAWAVTCLLFVLYFLWAILPDQWITWLGVTWYPNRCVLNPIHTSTRARGKRSLLLPLEGWLAVCAIHMPSQGTSCRSDF